MKFALSLTTAALLLAGCATNQSEDLTPTHPTSVLKADYSINGLYVPDYTGKQTVYTRENQRIIKEKTKFSNWLMRWANSDTAVMADLPNNKAYNINYANKEYSECPITGCNIPDFATSLFEKDEKSKEYQTYEEVGCAVDLKENSFNVEKTGKTRIINGFPTEQYLVTWTTRYQDTSSAEDKNVVSFDFWTTTPNSHANIAMETHEKFQDNYLNSFGDDSLLIKLLGRDGYKAIAGFTGDISNQDNQFGGSIGKKLAQIKGYPISIKLEWKQQLKACKATRKDIDYTARLKDVGSQLLGGLLDKGKEMVMDHWRKDPVVRYVYEIKSVETKAIHDSKFSVPKNFKLINRS